MRVLTRLRTQSLALARICSSFKSHVDAQLVSVNAQTTSLGNDMTDVKDRMGVVEGEIERMKNETATKRPDPDMTRKIEGMEEQLSNLRMTAPTQGTQVAVIGNLNALKSLEEADQWIRGQISQLKAPTPIQVFKKGDSEFSGLAFVRFSSADNMQSALAMLQNKPIMCKGKAI